jgi:hypothetical protein
MNTVDTPEQVDLEEQSTHDDIRVGLRRKQDTGTGRAVRGSAMEVFLPLVDTN